MRWLPLTGWRHAFLAAAAAMLAATAAPAGQRAVPRDPVMLNIGFNCQWQQRCIGKQRSAMKRALKLVSQQQPPMWKIELCNRNAAKSRSRVDWIGFENCIGNPALRPPPQRPLKKRRRIA